MLGLSSNAPVKVICARARFDFVGMDIGLITLEM